MDPTDKAYLTLYSQDFADAIAYLLRLSDPDIQTHFEPTGRKIPKICFMTDEHDWWREAEEFAEAAGVRLKQVAGVWFLAPCCTHGTWKFE